MVLLKTILYPLLFVGLSQPQVLPFILKTASRFSIKLPFQGAEVIIGLIVLAVIFIESQLKSTQIIVKESFENAESASLKIIKLLKGPIQNKQQLVVKLTSYSDLLVKEGNSENEQPLGKALQQLIGYLDNNDSMSEDIIELVNGDSQAVDLVVSNIVDKYSLQESLDEEKKMHTQLGLLNFVLSKQQADNTELPEESKSNSGVSNAKKTNANVLKANANASKANVAKANASKANVAKANSQTK